MATRAGRGTSGPKGMILLARNNRILEVTVKDQIMREPDEKAPPMLDVKLCDFDEVSYNVKMPTNDDAPDVTPPMLVSISLPCYSQIKDHGTDTEIKKVFGDLVAAEPVEGFDVTINVDIAKVEKADKHELITNLSLLKFHCLSGVFKHYFRLLEAGTPSTESFQFDLRSDTSVYFCPRPDRVTIVYAVDFQEKVDKVIAKVFMQELADARKRIRTAPPFKWGEDPPQEIHGQVSTNPGILGYASIALMTAHIKSSKVDEVCGALINFRSFIQYHLKCAKSFFHSRMRLRCSELLKILNRARTKFGVKAKKTAGGKTFSRS